MVNRDLNKTIFLDRDGTINRESGYINSLSMFEFIPGIVEALKLLKNNGWQLIVITNQAGVARGYFDEDFLIKLHQHMQSQLDLDQAKVDGIYYCPHHPEVGRFPYKKKCDCRKPNTGLIDKAKKDYHVDIQESYMVGDRYSDILTGYRSQLKTVFIKSGYGKGEWEKNHREWQIQPDLVYDNLLDFTEFICNNKKM